MRSRSATVASMTRPRSASSSARSRLVVAPHWRRAAPGPRRCAGQRCPGAWRSPGSPSQSPCSSRARCTTSSRSLPTIARRWSSASTQRRRAPRSRRPWRQTVERDSPALASSPRLATSPTAETGSARIPGRTGRRLAEASRRRVRPGQRPQRPRPAGELARSARPGRWPWTHQPPRKPPARPGGRRTGCVVRRGRCRAGDSAALSDGDSHPDERVHRQPPRQGEEVADDVGPQGGQQPRHLLPLRITGPERSDGGRRETADHRDCECERRGDHDDDIDPGRRLRDRRGRVPGRSRRETGPARERAHSPTMPTVPDQTNSRRPRDSGRPEG